MPDIEPGIHVQPPSSTARADKVVLALPILFWGVNWPAAKLALLEIPPASVRVFSTLLAMTTLLILVRVRRRSYAIPRGWPRVHLVVGSVFNISGYGFCLAYAQASASTSRVAVLAYSMPVWSSILAYFLLKERFTIDRVVALALCVAGIAVLVGPLLSEGVPVGLMLGLATAMLWAAGTVYYKLCPIHADPVAVAAWQFVAGFVVTVLVFPVFDDHLYLGPISPVAIGALLFSGMIGSGVSFLLWLEAIRRVPAMTASLAVLATPLIGVISAALILREYPTPYDLIGFTLITAASGCVMLIPATRAQQANPTAP